MTEETKQEANQLIDLVADAVADLERFSVENDDIFSNETYEMAELIKRARRLMRDSNDYEGINMTYEMTGGEE